MNINYQNILTGGNILGISGIDAQVHSFTPLVDSTTAVHAAITLPTTGTTAVTTAITVPNVARNLSVTGNAATAVGNVVIVGTDITNAVITETIVANGTATVLGTKLFKTVTSITVPTRGAASDTISIGTGKTFALPIHLPDDTVFRVTQNKVSIAYTTSVTTNSVTLTPTITGDVVNVYFLLY